MRASLVKKAEKQIWKWEDERNSLNPDMFDSYEEYELEIKKYNAMIADLSHDIEENN